MFDPLASSPFAEDNFNPPWPTTPHSPNQIPNLRRSPNATLPHHPSEQEQDSITSAPSSTLTPSSTAGIYGKEPQIYGQPDQGLISPTTNVATNGTKFEKPEPYLRVRITMLDRNRRDILIKFDAQVLVENFCSCRHRIHLSRYHRQTCQTLREQPTATYRDHTPNFSNCTSP